MRVISGIARGKRLNSILDTSTRPTLDRVKESLFNIIQFRIKNSIVLDLFAGSGSLGIEALSRGARLAVFCDSSFETIKIINQNLLETKLNEQSQIINKDYTLALKKLSKEKAKFDIVFIDPPYKSSFITKAMEEIINLNLLSENGIVIIETNDLKIEQEIIKSEKLCVYDTRKYGKVILIFAKEK